jgi:hypothetical protein
LLAAALTFGLFVVGHFNADLKNFDRVMLSKPAILAGARRLPRLPDFSAFDIKTEVVHGLPVGRAYLAATIG